MRWIIFDFATLIFDITFLIVNIIQGSLWSILLGVCAVVVLASLIGEISKYRRRELRHQGNSRTSEH